VVLPAEFDLAGFSPDDRRAFALDDEAVTFVAVVGDGCVVSGSSAVAEEAALRLVCFCLVPGSDVAAVVAVPVAVGLSLETAALLWTCFCRPEELPVRWFETSVGFAPRCVVDGPFVTGDLRLWFAGFTNESARLAWYP